jgi:multidrug resistance efflux pump
VKRPAVRGFTGGMANVTASSEPAAMFRAEALEARRRIDALPRTIHVTSAWTKFAVAGVILAIGASVVASAVVQVPVQVSGSGAIVDRSGRLLASVASTNPGFIDEILVRPGDRVLRGDPIARIKLPEQSIAIAKLRAVAEGLERDAAALDALAEQSTRSEANVREARSANLDVHIANLERRIAWLQDREAAEKALLQKGVSTETRLIAAQVAVQDAVVGRDQARSEKAGLGSSHVEADNRRAQERLARRLRMDQARLELVAAERELATRSLLASPVDGVIGEILPKGRPERLRARFLCLSQSASN